MRLEKNELMMVIFVIAIHMWTLWAYGVTYWYDTGIYAELGNAFLHERGLTNFYSGESYLWFQHLMPGAALLWALAKIIGPKYGWLAIALLQKAVAIFSISWLLHEIKYLFDNTWLWVLAILLSIYPFYVSFQNALLTEAISSSLFMICIALIIGGTTTLQKRPYFYLISFIVLGILLAQFRAYLVLVVFGYLGCCLFSCNTMKVRGLVSISMCIILAGTFVFPTIRWLKTNELILPNVDILSVGHALYVNINPGQEGISALQKLDYPEDLPLNLILEEGMSHEQSVQIAQHMLELGYNEDYIKSIMRGVSWRLRTENTRVILSQIKLNMTSVGMIVLPYIFSPNELIRRNFTNKEYRRFLVSYYKWQSWMSSKNYSDQLLSFLQRYKNRNSIYKDTTIELIHDTLFNGIKKNYTFLKDPLFTRYLLPDALVILWIMGMMYMWKRSHTIVIFSVFSVGVVYTASIYATVVGNIRYSHPLLPLYLIGAIYGLQCTCNVVKNKRMK